MRDVTKAALAGRLHRGLHQCVKPEYKQASRPSQVESLASTAVSRKAAMTVAQPLLINLKAARLNPLRANNRRAGEARHA
jgi:hypothetical protein